ALEEAAEARAPAPEPWPLLERGPLARWYAPGRRFESRGSVNEHVSAATSFKGPAGRGTKARANRSGITLRHSGPKMSLTNALRIR
ncbi:hypothetical protein R5W24_004986, partial [Gemmata sp. JC717]|uniref:hypothetical protein n=1 Tax=Gemmata algarum TaxID=2975278 RepID=UPI0021BA854B